MTFDEILEEACLLVQLPNTAREQLPRALSDKTKQMALKLSPEELGRVLKSAIETINHGLVESIEALVRKQLGK